MGLGDHRHQLPPPLPTKKQAPWLPVSVAPQILPELEFTIPSHHSPEVITAAQILHSLEHTLPTSPKTHTPTASSMGWRRRGSHTSGYLSITGRASFSLQINDSGSQTSAFFKLPPPPLIPMGDKAEKQGGNAGPQPLSPSGARLSPHQLSFMFLASPFMSFLLAFFHLSPGQAPNWKTETQKPRQALESQSCPEKEAPVLRGKSQIPECEREGRLPHMLGSC